MKRIRSCRALNASMMPLMPSPGSPKTVSTFHLISDSTRTSPAVGVAIAYALCAEFGEIGARSGCRNTSTMHGPQVFPRRGLGMKTLGLHSIGEAVVKLIHQRKRYCDFRAGDLREFALGLRMAPLPRLLLIVWLVCIDGSLLLIRAKIMPEGTAEKMICSQMVGALSRLRAASNQARPGLGCLNRDCLHMPGGRPRFCRERMILVGTNESNCRSTRCNAVRATSRMERRLYTGLPKRRYQPDHCRSGGSDFLLAARDLSGNSRAGGRLWAVRGSGNHFIPP